MIHKKKQCPMASRHPRTWLLGTIVVIWFLEAVTFAYGVRHKKPSTPLAKTRSSPLSSMSYSSEGTSSGDESGTARALVLRLKQSARRAAESLTARSQLYRELQNQDLTPISLSRRPDFSAGLGVLLSQGRRYRLPLPSQEDRSLLRELLVAEGSLNPPSSSPPLPMRLRQFPENGEGKIVNFLGLAGKQNGFMLLRMQEQQDGGNVPDHIYWQPLLRSGGASDKDSVDPQFVKTALTSRAQRESSLLPPGYVGKPDSVFSQFGLMFAGGVFTLGSPDAPLEFIVDESAEDGWRTALNLFLRYPPADVPLSHVLCKRLTPTLAAFLVKQVILESAMMQAMGLVHLGISIASFFFSGNEVIGATPANRLLYLGNTGVARYYTGQPEPFEETGHSMYHDPSTASNLKRVAPLRHPVVFSPSRDAWAVGVVIFQLLCGGHPHPFGSLGSPASPLVTASRISRLAQTRPQLRKSKCFNPSSAPDMEDLQKIMDLLLAFEESERPTTLDILREYPHLFPTS